ncbi:MAG: glycosyltransferase family 39 protein [Caldilineales bacterium]
MASFSKLRLAGVAAGIALVYIAQYFFNQPPLSAAFLNSIPAGLQNPLTLAAVILVAGALIFALSAPAVNERRNTPATPAAARFADHPSRVARPLFLATLLAYGSSLALYLLNGESAPVRWLWLGSVVLLIVSQVPWDGLRRGARGWAGAWRSALLPGLLLLVAAVLRLYQLADLPQDLHGDMASHGLQAQQILAGAVPGIVGVGWADIPLPGFLPTVAAMALTGDRGTLGLALASALGGVLAVWGTWVLLRTVQGRRVALIGTALLAVAYTHIHFSRIAEYMDPVPFVVWSLAFLAIGLQKRTSLPFALSGVLAAGASLMYFSGRIVFVILAALLIYLLIFNRPLLRANLVGLAWLLVGGLVALGPMTVFFVQQPGAWLSRSQQVILFNPAVLEHSRHKYGVETTGQILLEQFRRTALLFNYSIDSSTQFGFPRAMVDTVTAPWIVLGAVYGLAHFRRWGNGLLVVMLGAVLLVGSVLTDNAPFYPRLIVALVPALGLAALAVDRTWDAVVDALGQETGRIVLVVVAGGLIYIGLVNWVSYYQFAAHNGQPRALVARYVASLPADATVCIVPEEDAGWIHSTDEREIDFMMGDRRGEQVAFDENGAPGVIPEACAQPGAVWIVPDTRQAALGELEARFPGGDRSSYGRRQGEIAFWAYVVR